MIDLIPAGNSFKMQGLSGAIRIQIEERYKNFVKREAVLFFNLNGNDVPFFIEQQSLKNLSLVKFKGVDTPEQARVLCNQEFYIDKSRIIKEDLSYKEEETPFSLVDYTIKDSTSNKIVRIISIEEFPQQIMALVELDSQQYYLPLREEWIREKDEKNKQIMMILPEGMFD